MASWLERARAEISKAPGRGAVNTAVQKSIGTIGSTPSPHFLKIETESGLIFPRTAGQGTAVRADRNPEPGIWRQRLHGFTPQTIVGVKLHAAALAFLDNEIAVQAVELGWSEPELFGALDHGDVEAIKLRADAKGVVSYVALAVWPRTRLESFAASHAVIVTGSGAVLRRLKWAVSNAVPFWNCSAL
jgi:hypothetical protein